MDQATLDRIAELIELKRNTDNELANLIGGEVKPKKKWTRRTVETPQQDPPAEH